MTSWRFPVVSPQSDSDVKLWHFIAASLNKMLNNIPVSVETNDLTNN